MNSNHRLSRIAAATAMALGTSVPASAVYLSSDGVGQALIYPYYTVRSTAGGNSFNTYISVVNTTTYAEACRVRVREGLLARQVLSLSLFLAPSDAWAAAIVPAAGVSAAASGARLLTTDNSCTDPELGQAGAIRGIELSTANLNDGFGDG